MRLAQRLEMRFQSLRPRLHRYCARMAGLAIDGEDVLQDTLVKALAARERGASVDNLENWLFRIAHNASLDFVRARSRNIAVPFTENLKAAPISETEIVARARRTVRFHLIALFTVRSLSWPKSQLRADWALLLVPHGHRWTFLSRDGRCEPPHLQGVRRPPSFDSPDVNSLTFTGSTLTGKRVVLASIEHARPPFGGYKQSENGKYADFWNA